MGQGLEPEEMMCADSRGEAGGGNVGQPRDGGGGFPQADTPLCHPWALVPGSGWGEAGPGLYGAASRIPSEPGVLMPTLVLPVLSLFSERENCEKDGKRNLRDKPR